MDNREIAIQIKMTAKQTSDFFREMADCIEGKEFQNKVLPKDDISGFKKIKIEAKKEEKDIFSLKMKIKCKDKSEKIGKIFVTDSNIKKRPSYKDVKKRMKKSFKEISHSLTKDSFPSEEIIKLFLSDSELMISYPKDGDEYYADYERACNELKESFEKRDLDSCKTKCYELNQIKTVCHNKYK